MKNISFPLVILIILLLSTTSFAQTPKPTPPPVEDEKDIVKISTTLIQLDVTVTDREGNIVTDLKPGDLEVYENGKKQEVTNFSFVRRGGENDAPAIAPKNQPTVGKIVVDAPSVKLKADQVRRTYTVVVDDLGLNFGNIFFVKQALKRFINEQMEAGDLVAIVRTGKTNGAFSSFTSDKRQLLSVIEKIKWGFQGRSEIGTFSNIDLNSKTLKGLEGSPPIAANDELSRQMEASRNDNFSIGTMGTVGQVIAGMRDLPGRKAIMLFSEGFPLLRPIPGYKYATQNRVLDSIRFIADKANRASVVIYTVDPRGLQNSQMFGAQDSIADERGIKDPGTFGMPGNGADQALKRRNDSFVESQQSLRILAEETGGLAFTNQNNIDKGLRRAVEDQSSYYLLGYVPDEETFDPSKSKFNNLEIKAVRPGLKLRYRSGFFGVSDEKYLAEQKAKENNVAAALSSPFGASDINLDLTSIYANDAKEGDIVRALMNIDAKDLSFADLPDGGKQAEFVLYAFVFGENGRILNSLNRSYRVKISRDDYQKAVDKGFVYFMNVPFKKPGAYQLRIALQDMKTKKIGAANQFIEVPNLEKNRLTLSGVILQTYTNEEWSAQNVSTGETKKTQTATATAIRKFKQGSILQFSYAVYNAKNRPGTNFKSQTRLYRDGQLVFEGKQLPLNLVGNDGKRAEAEGAVGLGREMIAGDYVLQVIVFDETARDKDQITAQSIDFEVIN